MWGNKMENSAVVYEKHMMAASGKQWFKKKKSLMIYTESWVNHFDMIYLSVGLVGPCSHMCLFLFISRWKPSQELF